MGGPDDAGGAGGDVEQQVARSLAESGYPLAAYLPHLSPHHFLPKVRIKYFHQMFKLLRISYYPRWRSVEAIERHGRSLKVIEGCWIGLGS